MGSSSNSSDESGNSSASDANGSCDESSSRSDTDAAGPEALPSIYHESEAEHLERCNSKTCARCHVIRNRDSYKKVFRFKHPLTDEWMTWICETPDGSDTPWSVGCSICRKAHANTKFGRLAVSKYGGVQFTQFKQHEESKVHQRSLAKWMWKQDPLSSTSQTDGPTLEKRKANGHTSAEDRTADGQISAKRRKADGQTSTEPQGISFMHIRCLLYEVHREGSAGDFTRTVELMQSSGAPIPPGNAGAKVFSNLVTLGGALEKRHTRHFLKHASLLSLSHDAKDPYLLAHIGGVIWKLQRPLEGAKERLRSILPEGGPPYIFERLLSVLELTHKNRSGTSAAKELVKSVAALAGADHVDEVIPKVRYDVKDNAADEAVCGRTLQETFTECINLGDTMHTLQLILKDSVAGEPLVVLARGFLLGNTEPHKSVSSMLAYSSRLRSLFKENQLGDAFDVLSGMNWAPQRVASQSRPYGRASLKFGGFIGMLAEEAETAKDSEDRAAARFNLTGLAPYRVSMTNALMADLTFEHRQTTLWSDQDQPDISEFDDVIVDLLSRCRVWFEEGLIMSDDGAASDTYTRQVLNFYRSPRFAYSGNYAYLFALPADANSFFEPLERVRVIVGNLKDAVLRQFPPIACKGCFALSDLSRVVTRRTAVLIRTICSCSFRKQACEARWSARKPCVSCRGSEHRHSAQRIAGQQRIRLEQEHRWRFPISRTVAEPSISYLAQSIARGLPNVG